MFATGKNEYKNHQWSLKTVTTNRRITFVILFFVDNMNTADYKCIYIYIYNKEP